MINSRDALPPPVAERILAAVAGDDADHVTGDLREEFAARAESLGPRAARAWYRRQVLRSIVPLVRARAFAARAPRRDRGPFVDSLRSDVSFALRALSRRPAFTTVAVLALALGIGTATAIFTVVDGVLLRPLPFADGLRLVTIWQTDTLWRRQPTLADRWNRSWFTYPDFQQWSARQQSLSSVALFGDQEMALTGGGEPVQIQVSAATPDLLATLRMRVAFGRWFQPGEVGPGAPRIAVIAHELWLSRFGGDSSVVGRALVLDDSAYVVVGVLPPEFALRSLTSGARTSAAIWIPLGADGGGKPFDSSYEGIGRLRAGVSLDAAGAEIDRLQRAATGKPEKGARLVPRLEAESGSARRPLALLGAGVALLLLTACINVAMLLLGEAPSRAAEIATRRAIGAPAGRILRQLLTESLVLAALGGVLGSLLAFGGVRMLLAVAPPGLPRIDNVSVSLRGLLFALVTMLGTALAFGLVPALAATRTASSSALRARAGDASKRHKRLQGVAIGLQIAAALVLLFGATVLTRSLRHLAAVDPGIRSDGILTMTITAPAARYQQPAAVLRYFDDVEARLRALPGVRAVAATSNLPFTGRNQTTSVETEGTRADAKPNVQRRTIRGEFFRALEIPLRAGRLFDESDGAAGDAMIVDEAMAQRLWPNEPALGKRVKAFGGWFTVVGVVGSVYHQRRDQPPRPTFYVPHARQTNRQMTFVVALDRDPLARAEDLRRAVWSVDPVVPIATLSTLSARVDASLANERFRAIVLDVFGAAALLLAGVGVFGVALRAVRHRRRELGIRIALGAQPGGVARAVATEQAVSVIGGLVAGLAVAIAVAPWLRDFAFDIKPLDSLTIVGVLVGLLATSALAAIPALRSATRIDPITIIRDV